MLLCGIVGQTVWYSGSDGGLVARELTMEHIAALAALLLNELFRVGFQNLILIILYVGQRHKVIFDFYSSSILCQNDYFVWQGCSAQSEKRYSKIRCEHLG